MKVYEKTKKSLYKTLFLMTSALFVVAFVSCKQPAGPEQSSEQPTEEDSGKAPEKKPEPPVDNNIFLGTWAWDYGYNQDNFSEERLTLNKDNTFIIQAKFPDGYTEDDKGTYEIVTDSTYGQTLRLHITSWKDNTMQNFDSADVLLSYKCYFDGEDTMHLDRFKKDFSRQGGPVYDFNPPVRNIYYRVKDGTKENLAGKWRVNKLGTPDCDWDEEWTFNAGDTMVEVWTESGHSPETYNGTYEVIQEDGKNILHQILDWGTKKPEWWYEYKSYGPNVISVQMVESTSEGKVSDAPVNYYYRDIETETFIYHVSRLSLKHVVPKASSYTLIDNACQLYHFEDYFTGQEFVFEGWYDNLKLEGNKVTTSNGAQTEFWSKNAPRITKNQWGQGQKEYNYCFDAFIDNIIPGIDFNPNKGDCLVITIEGTLESDLDGWTTLYLTDRTNDWRPIAQEGKNVTTKDKKFKTVYTLNIPPDAEFPSDKKMFSLNFTYEKEACDRPNVLYNGKVTYKLLNNTNSYSVKYHIGQFTKETRAPVNEDYTLTTDMMDFESVHWNLGHYVASGSWYENENFTGSPITTIGKNTVNANGTEEVYLKPVIKFDQYINENDPSDFMYHCDIPAAALLSTSQINSISDSNTSDVISFNLSATVKNELTIQEDAWGWFTILNNHDGAWDPIAELKSMAMTYSNKQLNITFNLKKIDGKTMPANILNDLLFNIGLDKEFCADKSKQIEFTDSAFTLLNDSNSYKVNYHIGDIVYTEKFLSSNAVILPTDMTQFRNYDWDLAYGTEVGGWKDAGGTTITQIPAGNTTDVDVYLKFIPHMNTWCADGDGKENDYYSHVPAKMLLSEDVVNSLAGTKKEFTFKMTAKSDKTPNLNKSDRIGVCIMDASNSETLSIELSGGVLSATFKVKPYEELTAYPSADELYIDFVYLDDFCSDYITFTDFTLEVTP